MNKGYCRKVYEILDVLLYSFAILPGLRDKEDRDLLIFPIPDKDSFPTYDEISTVCSYLLSVPKKSVINRGIVVIIDTTDKHSGRLSDLYILLRELQANNPGCIVVIHLLTTTDSKKEAATLFKEINPNLGIEVQCNTVEELLKIIPVTSLPTFMGGQVSYNNDVWVKFRCNVEPFLSDCKSMGKRLEDLVRPLIDVESVLSDTCDVTLVAEKYRILAATTMKNLKIEALLDEGGLLIERYTSAAAEYPDMRDTLTSISDALAQLGTLQGKVQVLAEKGRNRAQSMVAYTRFKRSCDNLLHDLHQLTNEIRDMSDEGLYDVNTVQSKQALLQKLLFSGRTLEVSVNRCIAEGLNLEDTKQLKDAERDIKLLKHALEKLNQVETEKKEKLNEILSFHKLVEECMSWFFSGLQRFTAQPVQRCNTLDGICELEEELDRHLSRCPIDGYGALERYSGKIATKPVISRVKMIKSKFSLFEKIITERQEYLRRLKNALLLRHRNTKDVDNTTLTALSIGKKAVVAQLTQSTQFDPMDIFGCIRNSAVQTDLACVCSADRLKNLSARITLIESRLNLTDRSRNVPVNATTNEQLRLILRRLNIIENYLKRLRFSSVYDTFYEHPKLCSRNSSELLLDLQNTSSLQDSGFNSRPPTELTTNNRSIQPTDSILTPPTLTSSVVSPVSSSLLSPGATSALSPSTSALSPSTRGLSLSTRGLSPSILSPRSHQEFETSEQLLDLSDISSSGQSTPTSARQSYRYAMTSPLSPYFRGNAPDDTFNEKLSEIERLLIDIEFQIQHDLKVDGETQTGDSRSNSVSDSSSQTESESETESVGTQHETESTSSGTQHETSVTSAGVQVVPDGASVATDTGIVRVSSSSQSEPGALNKTQHSQTPQTCLRHVSSQHVSNTVSTAIQHNNPGRDAGVQMCPVHCHASVQNSRAYSQSGSQTFFPETTSSESQVDSDSTDTSVQTEMIGLFPASVQTDVQHFAARASQTVINSSEIGVNVSPDQSDESIGVDMKPWENKETTADIKPQNHKEVEVNMKSPHHKSVGAILQMRTQSTAAIITKMFNKSSNTTTKHFKQREIQTVRAEEHVSVDTTDLQTLVSMATDTDSLIYLHDESSQTSLFETILINTPCQTDIRETLLPCSLSQSNVNQETQTSEELLVEPDSAAVERVTGKRKLTRPVSYSLSSRSDTHLTFKDVSYNKNKTHELRVAKIQRSREEAENKAAKAKKPLKRTAKSKSKEDLRKSQEDVRRNKEDVVKSKEDVRRSREDDVGRKTSTEEDKCTCNTVEEDTTSSLPPSPISQPIEEEEEEGERETDSEGERSGGEEGTEDRSTASYIFPTEEIPTPITETPGQDKYKIHEPLPKKLQYVIQEMLTTEEKYVEDLRHIVEGYMEPMQHHPDPSINTLAENIFQYFGQIYSFHLSTFRSSLIAAGTSTSPLKDIATTFVRHDQELEVYLSFMVHERRAHAIVEQHHEGVISELERSLQDKLGLSAYLIKPTQRMVKYKQFLDIILAGAEEFEELEEVTDAQTMVTNILNTSNDLCHLQALQLPPDVSHDTAGELLRQADFHVSVNNKQKRVRRIFLFENIIVFSKEVTSSEDTELRYRTKHVVGLHEIGLTPYITEEPNKCHIWTQEMTFTMYSASPNQAESWSKSISNILWGQLKQIKRDRDMSRLRKSRGATRSRGALPRSRR